MGSDSGTSQKIRKADKVDIGPKAPIVTKDTIGPKAPVVTEDTIDRSIGKSYLGLSGEVIHNLSHLLQGV